MIKNNKFSGFTVVEIMLIIMLVVLLISAIIPFIFYEEEKKSSYAEQKEEQNILLIKNALQFYQLDNGFYPSTKQGLEALVKKPKGHPEPKHWAQYMSDIPVDQWNRAYEYINYDNADHIEIFSCGPPKALQHWWYRIQHSFSPYAQYCKKRELLQ